mmetsp:Transcript_79360/g.233146  ORF Transcript_79360/g.233146 Transcript_79360/m.233146 type:complete len:508 (-) Transcript_79360:77-1600(-)
MQIIVVVELLGIALASSGEGHVKQRPHLIYVLADDYGWADVGFHAKEMHTPNIDKLATAEGAELTRMYAYRFCSPSRSSLMSGRLPHHVNQENSATWGWDSASVHPSMTMLPEKLQEAGYFTVQVGKWHLGLSRQAFTPAGRGFNESLAMLMGSEDHWTQRNGAKWHVDLWDTDKPAYGRNGTYSAELFGSYAVQSIQRHHRERPSVPLFMYLAFTVTHAPMEAPQRFIDMYPSSWVPGRRTYAAMASALDEAVGNVTRALKETGLWDRTLLIFSSDNGGPTLVHGQSFANNWPLRGGKGNGFEGGTRVCAAVSGGFLPPGQRGRKLPAEGHMHFADVYRTFCRLAGHPNCEDQPRGVPPLDSYDLWPVLSGQTDVSPRSETVLEFRGNGDAALLQNEWKFISGGQAGTGFWWGPEYPNSSTKIAHTAPGCPDGCLFNITADPTEHQDLSAEFPDIKASLKDRLDTLGATLFQSDADGQMDVEAANAAAQASDWWCPWLDASETLVV